MALAFPTSWLIPYFLDVVFPGSSSSYEDVPDHQDPHTLDNSTKTSATEIQDNAQSVSVSNSASKDKKKKKN